MGLLTRAYNSDNSPHIATVVLSIGSALLFSVGLFLIVNAQFSKQAKTLKSAQTTINKLENDKDAEFDTITVNEESNLNGDLNVGGSTTLSGDLSVSGAGSVNTVLGVDGDTNFDQTLDVKGGVLLKGDMSVLGATTLQSSVAVGGDTSLGEGLNIGGSLNGKGDFSSSGATTIRGSVSVGGDTTFDLSTGGTFTLQGGFATSGDLSIAGTTVLQQGLSVSGNESTSTFDGTGVSNGSTVVLGSGPSFQVQGSSSLKGDVNVLGTTLLNGPLEVTGMAVATDFIPTTTFDATGSSNGSTILLGGTSLTVAGATTLKGDFNLNGTAVLNDALTVTGLNNTSTDYTPTITFDGRGESTANNVTSTILLDTVNPTFKVVKDATLQGDVEVYGTTLFGGKLDILATNGSAPDVTFDARNADGTAFLGGTSFQVTGAVSMEADLTVNGSASMQTLTVTGGGEVTIGSKNADDTGFLGPQPILTVTGVTTVTADFSVEGATALQEALNVTGTATFDGDFNVNCVNGSHVAVACNNNNTDVGGTLVSRLIYGTQHISAAEFGINTGGVGSPYHPGATFSCGANKHVEINSLNGGLVLGEPAYNSFADAYCVKNQRSATASVSCDSSHHARISEITDGLITGVGGVAGCAADGSGNDLAEDFMSVQMLTAGDVVSLDPNQPERILKSNGLQDNNIIGVVSTKPGYLLSDLGAGNTGYPVALAGRVPVNVTNEGGAIAPGDYLTSSSTPGYAMKAGPNDKTIGQALEAFNGTSGQVKMFVNVSKEIDPNSSMQASQMVSQGGSAALSTLNVGGMSQINDLKVTGSATIANLTVTGTTSVVDIIVGGHIIGNADTRGSVTLVAGQTVVHHDFTKPYDSDPTLVASPVGQSTLYNVTTTATGFDITIPAPLSSDQKFNYLVQQ